MVKSCFSAGFEGGNKVIMAGNMVKASMNDILMPIVIIQPKSITGLMPLMMREAKATIVVIEVKKLG